MADAVQDGMDFAALEKSGWSEPDTAADYARVFAKATDMAVPVLVGAVAAGPGMRVLDLCCGQGNVTEGVLRTGAEATGLDFSPAMLEMARQRCPAARLVEGDAGDLPFEDGAFDAITWGFGLLHVPDPPRALSEARRVLKTGGPLAYSIWLGDGSPSALSYLFEAIGAAGDPDVTLPPGPGLHDYAMPEIAEPALARAGFSKPSYTRVDSYWDVDRADAVFDMFRDGTVRGAAMLRAQGPDHARAIRETLTATVLERHGAEGPWRLPIPAVVVRSKAI